MKLRLSLRIALLGVLALASAVAAAPEPADFVDGRGRLDLDALLTSGYGGPVDLTGLQVTGREPVTPQRFREIEEIDRQPTPAPQRSQPASGGGCWSGTFPIPGIYGWVSDAVVFDGRLVVAGDFLAAGDLARNVAAFDGTDWSPLGTGINGSVTALTVWNGQLIAGGWFTVAGGVGANRIASWDGSAWSPLGAGVSNAVEALAVSGADLIVAGDFTVAGTVYANRIARWDGSEWFPLGDGLNDDGDALTVWNGNVIVAGYFTAAGTTIANGIAAWDGSTWSALGPGAPGGGVHDLAVHAGQLVAAGSFEEIGLAGPPYLAVWNGATWGGLGDPQYTSIANIEVMANELYAATGGGPTPPGSQPEALLHWNGSGWTTILETDHSVSAILEWDGEPAAILPAGNNFTIGMTWDGIDWSALPSRGLDDDVKAATIYQGDLVIAGDFDRVDNIAAQQIARWDGTTWFPLGTGLGGGDVFTLMTDGVDLYAGGNFTDAGGVAVAGIARWNGSAWSALAGGDLAGSPLEVRAIEKHAGALFVGGEIDFAGGTPVRNLAVWNGAAWDSLSSTPINQVRSLRSLPGGLAVGMAVGSWSESLLLWDGVQWSDPWSFYPSSWAPSVEAITEYGGDLVIGGALDYGDTPGGYYGIARWDGGAWVNLGAGLSGDYPSDRPRVNSLAVHDGTLVAGGYFRLPGGTALEHLGAWNGMQWGSIGGGVAVLDSYSPPDIVACVASWGDRLVVGGGFVLAGGVISSQLAIWDCALATDVRIAEPSVPGAGLLPAFPNPFDAGTTIRYQLAVSGPVGLTVVDVLGRRVRELRRSAQAPAGSYTVPWDGRDQSGHRVAPGTYFVRLRTSERTATGKLTVLR